MKKKTGAKYREANKNRQQAQHKLAQKFLEDFRVLKMKNRKTHLSGKINFYKSTSQNSLSIDLFTKL